MNSASSPQLSPGTGPEPGRAEIDSATISPIGVFKISSDLLNSIESILITADQGVKISPNSDIHNLVISSLTWLRNSLESPKTLQDILHSNGEETGIRAYYSKTIANSFAEGFSEHYKSKQISAPFLKFFANYYSCFSEVSIGRHDRATGVFESAACDFRTTLKQVDVSFGLNQRHSDFKSLVQSDVEHLRATVPNSQEHWIIRCHDSAEEFVTKFPTAASQREVCSRIKEMSLEAALKRLAS